MTKKIVKGVGVVEGKSLEEYTFMSNICITSEEIRYVKAFFQLLEIDYVIKDDAVNIHGEKLPNSRAVYVRWSTITEEKHRKYLSLFPKMVEVLKKIGL